MTLMLIKGLIIGVVVSAPVGPIGILCLQRTLNRGRSHGFATALGATFSDLVYAVIAVFSMSFIIDFITEHHFVLQIIGSIIVFLFGLYIYVTNPVKNLKKHHLEKKSYMQDFLTSFGLTITNPLVVFLFIALFAKFSFVTEGTTFWESIAGIMFIMLGAFFWWMLLVNVVNLFRNRFNMRRLYVINQVTGIILMFLAIGSFGYSLFL
jgi:threonine/homoserine/homoserine lactone efflux protein